MGDTEWEPINTDLARANHGEQLGKGNAGSAVTALCDALDATRAEYQNAATKWSEMLDMNARLIEERDSMRDRLVGRAEAEQQKAHDARAENDRLAYELAQANAERDRYREALREHGGHTKDCTIRRHGLHNFATGMNRLCDCGWADIAPKGDE